MSDKHYYFRATIDFTVWDEGMARRLRANKRSPFTDETLGRALFDSIQDGSTEIDGIHMIEPHGDSEEGASY